MTDLKGPWTTQTVFCVDRSTWVRELTDSEGNLVAELKHESTEKPTPNAHEDLLKAVPEIVRELKFIRSAVAWNSKLDAPEITLQGDDLKRIVNLAERLGGVK